MKERLFLAAAILIASYAANFRPPTKIETFAGQLMSAALAGNVRKTISFIEGDPEDPSFSRIQARSLTTSLRDCKVKSIIQQGGSAVRVSFFERCGTTQASPNGPGEPFTRVNFTFSLDPIQSYQATAAEYFIGDRSRQTLLLSPVALEVLR